MARRHESSDGRKNDEEEPHTAHQGWEDIFQTIGQHSFIFGTGHKIIACNKSEREIISAVFSMRDIIGRKRPGSSP
jgi:hypothetical protein